MPLTEIVLQKVIKTYAGFTAIPEIDLTIEDGEFCVFVGPSGCGKSTLLRTIAGLEDVTAGRITIGGADVTHVAPGERGVAMVFQSYALYPHMTVAENMGYALKLAGEGRAAIREKVARVAETLHLGELIDRKPAALSGGQRQRVAIGRAIVREPKAFLFDEPLSNLDAELRVRMRLELAELHRRLGATMVYVTHDQVEAMTLADRIVVMRAGKIEQVGAPLELYDDPANLFVAGFIGSPSMNFFRARAGAGPEVLLSDFGDLSLRLEGFDGGAEGAELLVGIRPEHFDRGEGPEITVTPAAVESLGGITYAFTPMGDRTLCVNMGDRRDVAVGAPFPVKLSAAKAFLFDPGSGRRLV